MNSEEIRARIAELEAEAEQRAEAEADRRSRSGGRFATADPDAGADPWQFLFETPWVRENGLDPDGDDFSLNGWLADGLRGLRGYLRSAGLNDEFWLHIRGAERELLLAARVLIDTRLERLDDRGKDVGETNRRQEIEIDFD